MGVKASTLQRAGLSRDKGIIIGIESNTKSHGLMDGGFFKAATACCEDVELAVLDRFGVLSN